MAKRPVPKYDFKAFGAAIKAAREGRKESRKKVGDEMFISPRYLANIENKGQHPSLQIFFELIQRYHISVARATANVTHNHPEGIKGAESTASAIYMARNGSSKEEIKTYIEREFHYDLSRTLDNIRTYYHHVESCQETVPEAIIAFLESKDFEDAIRNAVSLGGDTDTLGAITGSIAEAFYGIPAVLIAECKSRIDKGLMTDVLDEFDHVLGRSVDTYSDEVDETQANQMIEAAIDQYYIQPVSYTHLTLPTKA